MLRDVSDVLSRFIEFSPGRSMCGINSALRRWLAQGLRGLLSCNLRRFWMTSDAYTVVSPFRMAIDVSSIKSRPHIHS